MPYNAEPYNTRHLTVSRLTLYFVIEYRVIIKILYIYNDMMYLIQLTSLH